MQPDAQTERKSPLAKCGSLKVGAIEQHEDALKLQPIISGMSWKDTMSFQTVPNRLYVMRVWQSHVS